MKKHKNEIVRWANSKEGTQVWVRKEPYRWYLYENPEWKSYQDYIVYDEWAELRKAQVEGKQLQHRQGNTGYHDADLTDHECTMPEDWRIKPEEPVFKVDDWCIEPMTKKPEKVTDIWFNNGLGLYMFSCDNKRNVYVSEDFIETEEPTYEWQWIRISENDDLREITNHYSSEKPERPNDCGSDWGKYEPSKRIKNA